MNSEGIRKITAGVGLFLTIIMVSAAEMLSEPKAPSESPVEIFDGGGLVMGKREVRLSKLDVRITVMTNKISPAVIKQENGGKVLGLPIRVENHSPQTISAFLPHEWYGGVPLGSDLFVSAWNSAVTNGGAGYLVGELDGFTEKTFLKMGQSRDLTVRLNWPGTRSCSQKPLIDANTPGKYQIRLTLVFQVGERFEYIKSDPIEVTIATI